MYLRVTVAALALAAAFAVHPQEKLGQVSFPVSCTPEAQKLFNRAMALYHSFHWVAVRNAFNDVLKADPSCAMAHFGLALAAADNPYVWPLTGKALEVGLAEAQQAKALGPKTQRERDYVAAVEGFFLDANRIPHHTRALQLELALDAIARRYPDDTEAQVLHALLLSVNYDPNDKKYTNQLKAAKALERIYEKHPDHPGVSHYLIHSYDYPPLAYLGLESARRYSKIAPSAPHALHMPSHTFTRVGYWQDSIDANTAVLATTKEPGPRLHSYDYMAYAYLQLGRDREAQRVVDEVLALRKVQTPNLAVAYALAAAPSRMALERGRWADAAKLELPISEFDFAWAQFPQAQAVLVFARGVGAARSGDAVGARKAAAELAELKARMLDGKLAYWADQADIQRGVVLAWAARAERRDTEALRLIRAVADHEDRTEKSAVTPGPILPAGELLADMLVETGRPDEALAAYEASMLKEPHRYRALAGAARAAELAGNAEKSRLYYAKLAVLAANADGDRPEVARARSLLAQR